jgi:hypothetical protein
LRRLGEHAEAALARIDPRKLFALAATASALLLVALQSQLSFTADEWDYLLNRPGLSLDVLLRPHGEHIVLGPVSIYKAIQSTLGMEKLFPYALVSTTVFLASVVALFVYVRRRTGGWLALAGALPVLFMGTAREVTIWPVNIAFTAAMAAGIAALLALEREDRRGDAIACGLLVLGLAFSELALFFAVGAAVSMVLARRPWSRAYVVVVPVLLYAGWYAGWGHTAVSYLSVHNVVHSPVYAVEGIASSAWSLLGVPTTHARVGGVWPALLALAALGALRARSRTPLPATFWSALAVLLCFWFLTATSFVPGGREPDQSRYQYVGGVLLLLVMGNAFAGIRLKARETLAVLAVACLATIANLAVLRHDYSFFLRNRAIDERGALAGLEVAGSRADPNLVLLQSNTTNSALYSLTVGPYLSAVDAFGSPADDLLDLSEAPETARIEADQLNAEAEHLAPIPVRPLPQATGSPPQLVAVAGARPVPRGSCLTLKTRSGPAIVTLPRPGVTLRVRSGSAEALGLRRFATTFPLSFELRAPSVLLIQDDGSPRAWQALLRGPGPVTLCGFAPAPG